MAPKKLIYTADVPNAKDHIISAHAVDALTSVSGIVRSSHQAKTHEIQSEVVNLLQPHLQENFGNQSRKIGSKESILVFSGECSVSIHPLHVSHVDLVLQLIRAFWNQTVCSPKNQGGTPPSPQLFP